METGGSTLSRPMVSADETLNPGGGVDLSVQVGPLRLAAPVMPASGCFGPELGALIPLDRLGAVVTKTVFSGVRSGNPSHRLTETAHGMLNAVGIPSPGMDQFRNRVLPAYKQAGTPVVVSVGGLTVTEYATVVDQLAGADFAALEVNVSCPNLEHGGLEIGSDPHNVEHVISDVVSRTHLPVIAKLTPNVARIDEIARAAEAGGASALTVANTFVGMSMDLKRRRPVLGNITGGVSGPAIKPMALRLVWQTAQAVRIPVVGCGGITTARDAVEFLLAGACAVQVGTATFTRPDAMIRIIDDLPEQLKELGASRIEDLIGAALGP